VRRSERLPSSRELARRQGVSRGAVVSVFEQLRAEGYLVGRAGSSTRVSDELPEDLIEVGAKPAKRRSPTFWSPASGLESRPFRPDQPALEHFPIELWMRIAGRRVRRLSVQALSGDSYQGYQPLCHAIADYLGSARGVRCDAGQVVITSGIQQGLDLLARLLVQPGDKVWMEDPAYFGARDTFRLAGAEIVPVPVDERGLRVREGIQTAPTARAAYVTPAHQFGMGSVMSVERRLELLAWARANGAYIVEDDYDGEYRFSGRPVAALQNLDDDGRVIYLGTFNKTLFPSLRLGYVVLPDSLRDLFVELRTQVDRAPPAMSQAILCDFLVEGHFGRHLRRMRELYAERQTALREGLRRRLSGVLEPPSWEAGLCAPAFLVNGTTSQDAERLADQHGVTAPGLHHHMLKRTDVQGVLLGFAAFRPEQIQEGVSKLARGLKA